ncbi:liprin-beta-2 isoform X3 [Parasteatoda tepidariorum]|uniref:liprin-beta-2 isoform X3 n=1 Tax=Parasteatoda tepidariorum TaxID=114398 RepID=UPI00077F8271|nr:liprin-beta-2 isoform X3 [Parasteatoda tepidariorum]
MKNQPTMECNLADKNGLNSSVGIPTEKQNGDDTEDDEDDDRNDSTAVTTSVADLCSASHEFEWLSPTSQGMSAYSHHEKQNDSNMYTELSTEHQQVLSADESGIPSCQASPARSSHHRHNKPPTPIWPRRSADMADHIRMTPSPYNELHGCRRHLSPMRSSWCCPSPPPHTVCVHHGGVLPSMELVPYNHDCCGGDMSFVPYQTCSCLPPTGLPHSPRYQESQTWCHSTSPHHEIRRRESSSPCAMHRSCQGFGGSRRSRSSSSRKRDCSPALSPRYSPVQSEQVAHNRQSNSDQWQVPLQSEDVNNLHKVQELESDKKNLILQASVLADQVEAQADKISELERALSQKKDDLNQLEHNLHQEVLARSAVENSKLELITELSNLRLRLTAAERDRKESDEKCRKLESEIYATKARLIELETEYALLKGRIPKNGPTISIDDISDNKKYKTVLDSINVSNEEKDQKLDDLRSSLTKYKKLQDIVLSGHTRKVADISSHETHGLYPDSILCSLSNDSYKKHLNDINNLNAGKYSTLPSTSSIPKHINQSGQSQTLNSANVSCLSPISSSFHKSNSLENISSTTNFPYVNQYDTLPRQTSPNVLQDIQSHLHEVDLPPLTYQINPLNKSSEREKDDSTVSSVHETSSKSSNRGRKSGSGTSKSSGVSFASEECVTIPSTEKENGDYIAPLTPQPCIIKSDKDKNKGLFKLFSKWKKSGSQNIDRLEGDFKRGGIRATAGPRLGWTREVAQEPEIPFNRWNTDMIVDWLNRLGLTMYISECRRWMCNGDMLSKASGNDLEKELSIKNPLHRKKLLLAIKSMSSASSNSPATINNLDFQWVVRWLDDVGLPQYKDSFADARVDGRVLHCLTVDDLLFLKVTSQLHHVSIKRGIQLLREKGFDPHCLIRRSLPDETSKSYTPELVALWSNHRVMEWLRTVDLSEYAPNLRGSGVHGALIVYELKFNTNLFATLLNIPPTKTLLRRHLATHFKHIVGDELMQLKREKETETPLSPSVKIKSIRKPQFALKKKRNKSDFENEEYVCPMDVPVSTDAPVIKSDGDKLVVRRNSDPSPQEQRHIEIQEESERIDAVSKDISSLTVILQDENLNEAPSTIV